MITAEILGLPPGKDVEALVATIALVVVALVFLLDRLRPAAPKTLDGSKVALPLVERVKLSHDTHLFRFGLPTPEHVLGLPIGQHVMLSYVDEDGGGGQAVHAHELDVDVGRVDLSSVYFPCEKFPAGGKVSQHMHS